MTYNEFQRELTRRGIKPQEAYMLSLMYERIVDLSQQIGMAAQLIEALTESVQGFVQLNESQQNTMRQFLRGGRPDGVEVESVAFDPDEDKRN